MLIYSQGAEQGEAVSRWKITKEIPGIATFWLKWLEKILAEARPGDQTSVGGVKDEEFDLILKVGESLSTDCKILAKTGQCRPKDRQKVQCLEGLEFSQ